MIPIIGYHSHVLVDGKAYPKDSLTYAVSDDKMSIIALSAERRRAEIIAYHEYDQYIDNESNGFANLDALSDYCRKVLFSSNDPALDQAIAQTFKSMVNVKSINKYGRNGDIDTASTPEDIISQGGLYLEPSVAQIHEYDSTSAQDASGGTGCFNLVVEGLDENLDEATDIVAINGTTPVDGLILFKEIYRMYMDSPVGSAGSNVGDIVARAKTDGTITAQIDAGRGQTKMAVFAVPRNKILLMKNFWASINRQGGTGGAMADMVIYSRSPIDEASPWRDKHSFGLAVDGQSSWEKNFNPYKRFDEKSLIKFECDEVTDNNTDITAGFDCLLIDL